MIQPNIALSCDRPFPLCPTQAFLDSLPDGNELLQALGSDIGSELLSGF